MYHTLIFVPILILVDIIRKLRRWVTFALYICAEDLCYIYFSSYRSSFSGYYWSEIFIFPDSITLLVTLLQPLILKTRHLVWSSFFEISMSSSMHESWYWLYANFFRNLYLVDITWKDPWWIYFRLKYGKQAFGTIVV